MADMTTIKGRIAETIYPNGKGAITAESHQALLLEMVDNINEVKQDVLVSGQNIRPLISGESLLGGDALAVLGTAFIYEYESEQVFAMMNGTREEVKPWVLNRATASQVAQSISILRQNVLQAIVPVVIKTRAESAIICWEYDGLIYEIEWENDAYKVVTTPKGNEFDKQGNYPSLRVGTADDLAGRGESVPAEFGFRASGGKSIKDGRAYIKRIKGNSVVWNQLSTTTELNESKTVESLPLGASIVQGHKYAIIYESSNARLYFYTKIDGSNKAITSSQDGKSWIFTSDYSATSTGSTNTGLWWFVLNLNSATTYSTKNIRLIDITKAFPNDWQNINTIEDFQSRVATLGVDLNAYNEGQVIHCNTESIKSVGDNAWDEEWEDSKEITANGNILPSTDGWITTNYTRVIPNAQYYIYCDINGFARARFYDANKLIIGIVDANKQDVSTNKEFTVPANAHYVKFTPRYSQLPAGTPLMLTLVHSGWKQDTDAGYQPYWQDTLPLPIIRKYFPDGMKSVGTAHDEIRFNKASGKWEYSKGRIKSVDMGSLTFSEWQDGMYAANLADMAIKGNILCAKYNTDTYTNVTAKNTGIAALTDKGGIVIYDATYTTPSAIKTALQGVMLYYEAAEWEWVELDEADQNFRDYYNVADFGTEQSQSKVPSAAFSADIIYQFNAVDMIREHELEITELQKVIATMQAQLTSLINGGQ